MTPRSTNASYGPHFSQDSPLGNTNFDCAVFDFDAFAILEWNLPSLSTANFALNLDSNHGLVFDDFDRSRIVYHMRDIPIEISLPLPPPTELNRIIKQYFEYVSQITPWLHVSSFSVRTCPTDLLLLFLAIGDVFSSEKMLERWARQASAYLILQNVEEFENSRRVLPLLTVQALGMYAVELAYSGDPQKIARSMRYRVCIACACRDRLREEMEENKFDAEDSWVSWVSRESRRRTLTHPYYAEMSISLHLGLPPMLKLSDLTIPLTSSNEVWFAGSESQWQELYIMESRVQRAAVRSFAR